MLWNANTRPDAIVIILRENAKILKIGRNFCIRKLRFNIRLLKNFDIQGTKTIKRDFVPRISKSMMQRC